MCNKFKRINCRQSQNSLPKCINVAISPLYLNFSCQKQHQKFLILSFTFPLQNGGSNILQKYFTFCMCKIFLEMQIFFDIHDARNQSNPSHLFAFLIAFVSNTDSDTYTRSTSRRVHKRSSLSPMLELVRVDRNSVRSVIWIEANKKYNGIFGKKYYF